MARGALAAHYDRFANCPLPAPPSGLSTDCSGNRIIGAPAWTLSAAGEYSTPTPYGRFVARVDFHFESPVYFDATNTKRFESDSHNIFGARIGLERENYGVFLWAKNVFDDRYVTYSDDRAALGVLRTTAYGAPRTFGVTLSMHY